MTDTFTPEFTPWPRTPRLFRDVVITEKLNGTNSAVHISALPDAGDGHYVFDLPPDSHSLVVDDTRYVVSAQSRKRIITPGKTTDNYGFADWVYANAADLVHILGEGIHFGEWWGRGIQHGYGLEERRFSLFNVARWWSTDDNGTSMNSRSDQSDLCGQIDAVPVLYEGPFSEAVIWRVVDDLRTDGSVAAPGFMNPEGVCVFHTANRQVWKVTTDVPPSNVHSLDIRRDASKWEEAA